MSFSHRLPILLCRFARHRVASQSSLKLHKLLLGNVSWRRHRSSSPAPFFADHCHVSSAGAEMHGKTNHRPDPSARNCTALPGTERGRELALGVHTHLHQPKPHRDQIVACYTLQTPNNAVNSTSVIWTSRLHNLKELWTVLIRTRWICRIRNVLDI